MRKLLIAIVGILLVSCVVVVIISSQNRSLVSPVSQNASPIATPTPLIKLKKYIDPSGFSFQYPETFILTPKEPLPQNTYTSIELTAAKEETTIILKVEDSSIKTLNSLVTATQSSSLKLGDMTALQFDSNNKKTTVALDQGVLFTVTLNPVTANKSWLNAYNGVISSFIFSQPVNNNDSSTSSAADDVIYEGEETVE